MNTWIIVSFLMIGVARPVTNTYIDNMAFPRDTTSRKVLPLPANYLSEVNEKFVHVQRRVNKHASKTLKRFIKQENKIMSRLCKVDSVAAHNLFSTSIDSLKSLHTGLKSKFTSKQLSGDSYLDTMSTSLKFLDDRHDLLGRSKTSVADVTGSMESLQGQLQLADNIKAYISERKQLLKAQLAQYSGFAKPLQKISKEAYYYNQQITECRAVLKDRRKAEQKAMELLKKMPVYNDFIAKNSRLASLFNLGVGNVAAQSMEGLQTRTLVEQLIQQRVGSDPGARQAVGQQMQQARAELSELKSKFPDLDNAGDMPDFKPNPMKTKRFLQRLEFGGNIQFQKSSRYFPSTSELAVQIGYRFHKDGTAGLGISYKLGLGTGWNDIALSHQGVGVRSFIDWKVKQNFFVNGGFEQNYVYTIAHIDQLRNWSGWKGSALLGISKKYKVSAKLKGNIMLLYDFLAKKNAPPINPIKVRFGYVFN